jgi:hypothetical protein
VGERTEGSPAVVIFARYPVLGHVKTRLIPPLTFAEALHFHIACLEATVGLVAALPASIRKYLYFTPHRRQGRPLRHRLRIPRGLVLEKQGSGDLGKRLCQAFRRCFRGGHERVVVIGSDSPTLPAQRILQAFRLLEHFPVVLGPARDGGYYLIGARAETKGLPELAGCVDWGTPRTFRQTCARLRQWGRRLRVLPRWHDVDTGTDLRRLERELRRTRTPHLKPLREFFRRRTPARG